MSKKILIFSVTFHPFVGGAEVAIKEIVKRLPQYQFTMLTAKLRSDLSDSEHFDNLTVIRVGRGHWSDKHLYFWYALKQAQQLHAHESFQAIWAMMANQAGLSALLFHWKSHLPYLLSEQSGDSEAFWMSRTWFWRPLFRQIYRRAARVQALSAFLAERCRRYGAKGEVAIIPNGVDIQHFTNTMTIDERLQKRQELGLEPEDTVLVTTSRLELKNAVSDLIKAVNTLQFKFGIPTRALILGSGSLQKNLQTLSESLGVSDRVIFVGHVDHQDVLQYLGVSDIFCRPSLTEGLGNSFLEAMAFGLPIIGTPVGGIVDFLKDKETGLFCQPGQQYTIAQAVKQYHDNAELVTHIRQEAKALVQRHYTWETVAQQMGFLLQTILP
jgi:glycosyltransferase involved in cell wall biosynthesis